MSTNVITRAATLSRKPIPTAQQRYTHDKQRYNSRVAQIVTITFVIVLALAIIITNQVLLAAATAVSYCIVLAKSKVAYIAVTIAYATALLAGAINGFFG